MIPEHTYREVRLKSGERKLLIQFEDPELELLEEFLQNADERYTEKICTLLQAVQEGEKEEGKTSAGEYSLAVFPAYTIIYSDAEDFRWIQINTEELYTLITEWTERLRTMKAHMPK